jgi:hypothetical protein
MTPVLYQSTNHITPSKIHTSVIHQKGACLACAWRVLEGSCQERSSKSACLKKTLNKKSSKGACMEQVVKPNVANACCTSINLIQLSETECSVDQAY